MSTAFYVRQLPSEDELIKISQIVLKGDVREAIDALYEFDTKIHICSRSCGWKVNFDHNWGKYYEPSRISINEFISQPNYEIIDEYGEIYTPEKFWKMVDDWNKNTELDDKLYQESGRALGYESYICNEDRRKVKEVFGITTKYNDFYQDGLRFAVFSDFS